MYPAQSRHSALALSRCQSTPAPIQKSESSTHRGRASAPWIVAAALAAFAALGSAPAALAQDHTITAAADVNGSISPSGAVIVPDEGQQAFVISPDSCYSIADVLVDGASVGPVATYTFFAVTGDHTIEASFVAEVSIDASTVGPAGGISPLGIVPVACGGEQAFTMIEDPCMHVADVLVDGISVGPVTTYTFTNVHAKHSIVAYFEIDTMIIAATTGSGGSITPSANTEVICGSDQVFSIVPDPCRHIADVLVDGVSVGAVTGYTFTNVVENHTIAASFALDIYGIAASAGTGGSISPSGNVAANCGSNAEFSITPDACYSVADVIVDGVSMGPMTSYTFEDVQTPHTISVTFSAVGPFTIDASAGLNGSITPSGNVAANCGSDHSFSIVPDPCYDVADVLVDGSSVGAVTGYTFTNVTANHTIASSFTLRAYAIAASAGAGGSISPSGNVAANCGSNTEFMMTPDACYAVEDVVVDGVSMGPMTSYTFEDVQTPHTIAASFAVANIATTTTLDVSVNPSACQGSLTLTARTVPMPATGTVEFFDGATSLGVENVQIHEATLALPTGLSVGDHTLSATFTPAGCYVASSSAAVPHTVLRAAVAVVLTPDVNPSTWGQAVTFTASVTPSTATGRITFKDSLTVLGIVDLVAGEAQIVKSNLYCGNHTVTATFSDDGCYDHGTSAPLSQAVHRAPSALSMTSDLNPNTWGETVKLTGTVTPTGGTNRVTFYVDGNPIGTGAVNALTGEAKLNVSNMLPGDHTLTASYAGDVHFVPSATAGPYWQSVMSNPPPQVTVMYPNGGEDLDVGSNVDLMWSATDNSAVVSVSLEVSRNNGATWDPIATDIANTGAYSWTASSPGTNTDATKVYSAVFRVTAKDDAGDDGADASDAGFSLFDLQSGVVVTALDPVSLDDGVRLSWSITNRTMFSSLALERAPDEVGPWAPLHTDLRDDAGLTVAEDRTADAGQSYFYRLLGTTHGGSQAVFGLVRGTAGAPREFAMTAAWPNPTRGPLSMVIAVSRTAQVKLSIVDLQGREVATLANDSYKPGRYRVDWDGRTDRGPVPAGLYFLSYVTPDAKLVKRVTITR